MAAEPDVDRARVCGEVSLECLRLRLVADESKDRTRPPARRPVRDSGPNGRCRSALRLTPSKSPDPTVVSRGDRLVMQKSLFYQFRLDEHFSADHMLRAIDRWCAVEDEGEVLDLLEQRRRDKLAAVKLMRKLLKKKGFAPEMPVTDRQLSYGAAKAQMELSACDERGLRKNNRAENSHQPVRWREHKMQRFKSPGSAERFLSAHAAVHNNFNIQRRLTSRTTFRDPRGAATHHSRRRIVVMCSV